DDIEAQVRHFDDADIRLDGAEGIVLGGDARLGDGVEQRRLADVRQADDPAPQAHFLRPSRLLKRPFFSLSGFFSVGFAAASAAGAAAFRSGSFLVASVFGDSVFT